MSITCRQLQTIASTPRVAPTPTLCLVCPTPPPFPLIHKGNSCAYNCHAKLPIIEDPHTLLLCLSQKSTLRVDPCSARATIDVLRQNWCFIAWDFRLTFRHACCRLHAEWVLCSTRVRQAGTAWGADRHCGGEFSRSLSNDDPIFRSVSVWLASKRINERKEGCGTLVILRGAEGTLTYFPIILKSRQQLQALLVYEFDSFDLASMGQVRGKYCLFAEDTIDSELVVQSHQVLFT